MSHESNSPVSIDDAARYFGVPVSLLQSAAPSNAEMIAALTEVYSWARDLPIPTPGTISAMQKVRVVRDALAAAPVAAQAGQVAVPEDMAAENARLRADLEKMWKARFMVSQALHNAMVGNQSAWIEWQHGAGAEAAMAWIHNGLVGPGLIPDGKEAQPWFDANQDDRYDVPPCPAIAAAPSAPAVAQQAPADSIDTPGVRALLADLAAWSGAGGMVKANEFVGRAAAAIRAPTQASTPDVRQEGGDRG